LRIIIALKINNLVVQLKFRCSFKNGWKIIISKYLVQTHNVQHSKIFKGHCWKYKKPCFSTHIQKMSFSSSIPLQFHVFVSFLLYLASLIQYPSTQLIISIDLSFTSIPTFVVSFHVSFRYSISKGVDDAKINRILLDHLSHSEKH